MIYISGGFFGLDDREAITGFIFLALGGEFHGNGSLRSAAIEDLAEELG